MFRESTFVKLSGTIVGKVVSLDTLFDSLFLMSASEETCGQSWVPATRKMGKQATDVGIVTRVPLKPGDAAHPNASTDECISGPDACLINTLRGRAVGNLFTAAHKQHYTLVDYRCSTAQGVSCIGFGVFSEPINNIAQDDLIAAVQSSDILGDVCTSKAPMCGEEEVVFSVLKDPPSLRLELYVRNKQGTRVKSMIPQETASNVMNEAINRAYKLTEARKHDALRDALFKTLETSV